VTGQYALSTAVEGGYQFDLKDDVSITPYARLAFVQMTSEEVKLSNGMKGNTGTPRSVTGEAGAKLAGKFSIGSTEFKPYLSAAVLRGLLTQTKSRSMSVIALTTTSKAHQVNTVWALQSTLVKT
jgi:outer membrane autotransporter protein